MVTVYTSPSTMMVVWDRLRVLGIKIISISLNSVETISENFYDLCLRMENGKDLQFYSSGREGCKTQSLGPPWKRVKFLEDIITGMRNKGIRNNIIQLCWHIFVPNQVDYRYSIVQHEAPKFIFSWSIIIYGNN